MRWVAENPLTPARRLPNGSIDGTSEMRPFTQWYQGGHTGFVSSQPVQRFIDDALVHSELVDPSRVRTR
jgi:hypothetical protein